MFNSSTPRLRSRDGPVHCGETIGPGLLADGEPVPEELEKPKLLSVPVAA
jgi:hypothetical protein